MRPPVINAEHAETETQSTQTKALNSPRSLCNTQAKLLVRAIFFRFSVRDKRQVSTACLSWAGSLSHTTRPLPQAVLTQDPTCTLNPKPLYFDKN